MTGERFNIFNFEKCLFWLYFFFLPIRNPISIHGHQAVTVRGTFISVNIMYVDYYSLWKPSV